MAETIYTDAQRGVIAYATSAKVSISIGGVQLSDDVLGINFTGSVAGTFDTETGIAEIPIAPGAQILNQYDIAGRLAAGVGVLENFQVLDLDNDLTPSDVTLLGQRTGGGTELVRVDVGNLPTGGGGEANLGGNVGVGFGTFDNKNGITLEMRSINPLNILEGALNAQSIELDFKDTAAGNIVGRGPGLGSGKPSFLVPVQVQTILNDETGRKLFQGNFQSGADVTNPGRALADADYLEVVDIDCSNAAGGDVTITLPDATGLTVPESPIDRSMPWCWLRVLSSENLAIVTTAITDELRSFNGFGNHDDQADTIYLGLSQGSQRQMIIPVYLIGAQWNLQGQLRDTADLDLTFDGPLATITRSTATESLDNTDLGNNMAIFDFVGAVALNVAGCTDQGKGIEIYKTTTGDITVTGGVGSTTIPSGEGRLLRVIPTGANIS